MPKKPYDYSKTIIYKIVCKDLNVSDVYVGHTTDFTRRKSQHKSHCHLETSEHYNIKLYKFIRDNGGWTNFDMIEIEKYPCNDYNEACSRERYWYELLNAKLNGVIPLRTKEEKRELNKVKCNLYRENHNEYFKEYLKNYWAKNKDKYNEKRRKKKNKTTN